MSANDAIAGVFGFVIGIIFLVIGSFFVGALFALALYAALFTLNLLGVPVPT